MPQHSHACDLLPRFDNGRQYAFFLLHLRHIEGATDHADESQPSLFVLIPGADFARYHALLVLGRNYLVTGLTWKILQRTYCNLESALFAEHQPHMDVVFMHAYVDM